MLLTQMDQLTQMLGVMILSLTMIKSKMHLQIQHHRRKSAPSSSCSSILCKFSVSRLSRAIQQLIYSLKRPIIASLLSKAAKTKDSSSMHKLWHANSSRLAMQLKDSNLTEPPTNASPSHPQPKNAPGRKNTSTQMRLHARIGLFAILRSKI